MKLFLLADDLANMYEETVGKDKQPEYKQQVAYLVGEAGKHYSSCRMIAIEITLLSATEWQDPLCEENRAWYHYLTLCPAMNEL